VAAYDSDDVEYSARLIDGQVQDSVELMKTVIIDPKGLLTEFAPIRPFFYPYLREGSLELIGPEAAPRIAERIRSWLRFQQPDKGPWQAVIILDSPCDDRADLPGSLFSEHRRPARTFILSVDRGARGKSDAPCDTFGAGDSSFIRLRYPAESWICETDHASATRFGMLRFAYFVLFLVDHGESVKWDSDKIYQGDSVDIDQDNLSTILMEYSASLTSMHNVLARRIKKKTAGPRTVISNPCSCREKPDAPPEVSVENIKDTTHWSQWQNTIRIELDSYVDHAYECLLRCREMYRQGSGEVIETEEDLRAKRDDCEKELNNLRNEIRKKRIHIIRHDWLTRSAGISRKVTEIFATRLSAVELSLTLFTGFVVLTGPYLAVLLPKNGTSLFTERPVLYCLLVMLGLVLVVSGLLGAFSAFKLRKYLNSALDLRHAIIKKLSELFVRNREYFSLICHLGAAVRNLESLDTALHDAQEEQERLSYIQSASAHHQKDMALFMISGAQEATSSRGIDVHCTIEPPFRQEVFAPAHYSSDPASIVCHIGAARYEFDSKRIPGLTAITMTINQEQTFGHNP